MWFSTASSAGKRASNATWEQGRSEQPKTQKNVLDPTISAPQSAPPKIASSPEESQLRLLEALVKEIKTPVTERNPPERRGSQSSTCSNRTIRAPPEGLNRSTTSLQELLDKHSDTTQTHSTPSGIEKQSGSGLGESSQQSCQSKGKQKAIDISSPLSDPHISPPNSATFSTLPRLPNLPPPPPAGPAPTVQSNPVSQPITQNQQFPPEAMASIMSWFSTGFSHVTSTLEGHQSAIAKRIEDDVKEIRQICMRTQEQQRNLSCEHYAKSKVKKKKRAGFVPDPKDDCVDAPTDHSKVTYNAFKACIRQHAHHLLRVSDYRLLTSSNCSITEDENFAYISNTPGRIQITADNFRLDLMRHRSTKFNIDAILVFALDFIEKTTKFAVKDAFYSHFKTIRDYYKDIEKVKNGMSMEELKDKKQLELKKSARQSRKNRLYAERLKACALDGGPFTPHMALLQEAGSAGCSSDESESEPDQEPAYLQKAPRRAKHIGYRRIEPIWRGTAFRSLMYRIDDRVDDLRSSGVNFASSRASRRRCGNVPRTRLHSNKTNPSVAAPPSLPRNCYNPVWYNSLPLEAKLRLDIKDWDWDFCNGGQLEVEGAPQTGHGDYCVPDPSDPFGQRRMQVDGDCGEGPSNSDS
ncbi:uncharacterized protein F5891DRAFT_979456 [Suillus fuscotomentosus]|uniref:Uncharacterized protein n=1 Tax=Suillus fuscotomentosus TaxID=1912939 RepID=A0AAD4HL39_9AGAM|nr:uncharacterized protein F5891DRAFT_979456 [Suillus fuscotomentosus]KAG1901650.1 hypothetical protein F5891DRAFT_979456 [Suillus fuscotomentosus]